MKFSTNTLVKLVFPLTLLALAAGIVFYAFPAIPQNIALDEVEFIRLAKALEHMPYTPYTPIATGHATLYFYMILGSIKLFGETVFAVRLPSALFGVLNVLLMYGVFRQVFAKHTAMPFFATFLFITMRWYFNFARFGFEATTVIFFELCGVYAYLWYKKTKELRYIFLSGLASGIAYNSYTPGRLFILLPVFFLFFESGIRQKINFNILKRLAIFIVPFILCTIPLNIYFQSNTDTRIYQLFYLQNEQLSIEEKIQFSLENIQKVSGQFLFQGDINGRHNYPGKPMLNPIQGVLFLAGLVLALKNWRSFHSRFFLVFFAIGILPPLLTYPWENPNALRSVTILPSLAYFMALPLIAILRLPLHKRTLLLGIFILISLSAIYELRTYFVFQRTVFPEAFELNTNFIQPYLNGNYFLDPNKGSAEL
ncbi:glycosyltransferase family 39 protein [Candidatus Woesebacteria bacterium]|nr:glycosyltransferase family 39 protein [Candidatus Woesebacteria bacterium]